MKRFVECEERGQGVLLPEYLDDYVAEDNPVRVIDIFVEELDLGTLGFAGVVPEATGRPAYHPGALLKIYVYGYINQIASSRRLERETQRNVEMMWLTGRLAPDFKTIADFRKDNGPAIRATCRQFIALCRRLDLFTHAVAAIDGSKFKAVNTRDKNFTKAKLSKRVEQVEASIDWYMAARRGISCRPMWVLRLKIDTGDCALALAQVFGLIPTNLRNHGPDPAYAHTPRPSKHFGRLAYLLSSVGATMCIRLLRCSN